jgi:replication factor C subunit 3/5|uniref:AAA+ ATPase domain-containing protein n=1 Tax=viral metagenome TaxID=1070528 RepID=A0A6C0IN01_9ZZZZ
MNKNVPWIEKYRPTTFQDIVLNPVNRQIFENILEKQYFPNLLFYGPPGTGKTTTIINLINEYQTKYEKKTSENIIHLNASDERGIDIIRNQIQLFVKSKNFFNKGMKFVILDEVDYMTKNAQQALKYLIQSSSSNIRYCLICNYISKIEEHLRNEFICIRFNQLPQEDIYSFLKNISDSENLSLNHEIINVIQQQYNSDIRSMINFIQLNQHTTILPEEIVNNQLWENIYNMLLRDEKDECKQYIYDISVQYNLDKKSILTKYFNYIIQYKPEVANAQFLSQVENIVHHNSNNISELIDYFLYSRIIQN